MAEGNFVYINYCRLFFIPYQISIISFIAHFISIVFIKSWVNLSIFLHIKINVQRFVFWYIYITNLTFLTHFYHFKLKKKSQFNLKKEKMILIKNDECLAICYIILSSWNINDDSCDIFMFTCFKNLPFFKDLYCRML